MSHFLFEDFCIFRVWLLGFLGELLATIEQYRISFKRNILVVNEQL